MTRRRTSTAQFVRMLRLITLVTLPPIAIALLELGRVLPPLLAAVFAMVAVAAIVYGVAPRVRAGFNDVPRSFVIASILTPLFDTLWSAALLSPITTGLFALAAMPLSLLRPAVLSLAAITQIGSLLALTLAAYGVFIRKRWIRRRRVEVLIDGLPKALDGYRIAHLSDLHIGSTTRAEEALRWVARANALGADLVAVTGDLVSTGTSFHDEVVEVLSALEGRDGVFACLGNHDYYGEDSLCARLGERGVRVLRNEGLVIGRGDEGGLFLAGVEDRWRGQVDLARALRDRPAGMTAILLAHNPDQFPEASRAHVDLTLSGHTHAGQIAVPFFVERASLARLSTRFSAGLFREGSSSLFVHAGLGTTGPSIRIGAAPEVVEIVLRARPSEPRSGA